VRLGRESAWEPDEAHGQIPFGLKMMDVDGTDVPLLEIRSVTWNAPEKESEDASA
jgi:protein involved in temperature-dependent protein secretion